MTDTYEVRLGCYKVTPDPADTRFRFRWAPTKVPSARPGSDPENANDVDGADVRLPAPDDKFVLTLTPETGNTLIQEVGPDNTVKFALFDLEGRIAINEAQAGRYTIVVDGTSFSYDAVNSDDTARIRDALVDVLNRGGTVKADAVASNTIALTPSSPTNPPVIVVSGPHDGAITDTPPQLRRIREDARTAYEILKDMASVDREQVIAASAAKFADLLEAAFSTRLMEQTLSLTAGALARNLYPVISRHYFGGATDLAVPDDALLDSRLIPESAFVSRVERALNDAVSNLVPSDGDSVLVDSIRHEATNLLTATLLQETDLVSDKQSKLKLVVAALAAGMHITGERNGNSIDVPLGELFASEIPFDAAPYQLRQRRQAARKRYQRVSADIKWVKSDGTTVSARPFPSNSDCFNLALQQAGAPDPIAWFVEDGFFEVSNPQGGGPDQAKLVFKPACGDGRVSIHVDNVGAEGAQYSSFVIARTDAAAPPSADEARKNRLLSLIKDQTVLEKAGLLGMSLGPPRSAASADGARVSPLDRVDWHEELATRPGKTGQLITETAKELKARQDAGPPPADLGYAALIERNRAAPLGQKYYYWMFCKGLGGEWSGAIPVQQRGGRLHRPPGTADEPAAFTVLAASQPPSPAVNATSGGSTLTLSPGPNGGYYALVTVGNAPIATPAPGDPPFPRYAALYTFSEFQMILFHRVPKVDLTNVTLRSFARDVDADLDYYRFQSWYRNLVEQERWMLVGKSVFNSDPAPGGFHPDRDPEIALRYCDRDQNSGAAIELPGGWEYLAVVLGKRSENICYQVPRTPREPGYDPSAEFRFPVVRIESRLGRLAAIKVNDVEPPRAYAVPVPVDAGTDIEQRAVRFEYSQPSPTTIAYGTPGQLPPAPTIRKVSTNAL